MMRKFSLAILTALSVGILGADPCDGRVELTGSFLYLNPSIDDTAFVIESPDEPDNRFIANGDRKSNDFDYHSGYQLSAAYLLPNCPPDCRKKFTLTYTGLTCDESRKVEGDFLYAIVLAPGRGIADDIVWQNAYRGDAKSSLEFKYHRLDALYSQYLYDCACFRLYLELGIEYDRIQLKEKYRFDNFDENLVAKNSQKSKLSGVGPEIGFSSDYDLCRFEGRCKGMLTLTAAGTASLLVSHVDTTYFNQFQTSSTNFIDYDLEDKQEWRIVPVFHFKAGLKYGTEWCCRDVWAEIGYQLDTYIHGRTRHIESDGESRGYSYTTYYNYSLQGLYVTLGVGF